MSYTRQDYDLSHLTINVGTDCSGLEAPLVALSLLNCNVIHKWSCDNDPYIKKHILKYHTPTYYYDDMMNRKHSDLPDIDLYICGWPCQNFSTHNKNPMGFEGKDGTICFEAIKTIRAKQPKYFVLENVKGLISHNKGQTFQIIKDKLKKLKYNICYEILNTKDCGVPQNRERLYILGIKDSPFYLKTPSVPCPDLKDFLIQSLKGTKEKCLIPRRLDALNKAVTKHNIDLNDDWIVTLGQSAGNYTRATKNYCPCLTTNSWSYYVTSQERFLTLAEVKRLQGFPDSFDLDSVKSRAFKQLGNAMSVNVLYYIFYHVLSVNSINK